MKSWIAIFVRNDCQLNQSWLYGIIPVAIWNIVRLKCIGVYGTACVWNAIWNTSAELCWFQNAKCQFVTKMACWLTSIRLFESLGTFWNSWIRFRTLGNILEHLGIVLKWIQKIQGEVCVLLCSCCKCPACAILILEHFGTFLNTGTLQNTGIFV